MKIFHYLIPNINSHIQTDNHLKFEICPTAFVRIPKFCLLTLQPTLTCINNMLKYFELQFVWSFLCIF